jgi:hypothetical protein
VSGEQADPVQPIPAVQGDAPAPFRVRRDSDRLFSSPNFNSLVPEGTLLEGIGKPSPRALSGRAASGRPSLLIYRETSASSTELQQRPSLKKNKVCRTRSFAIAILLVKTALQIEIRRMA